MTKDQFEESRRRAVADYLESAQRDRSAPRATKRQRENADRRILRSIGLLSTWSRDGFWTPENIRAYEMIYQYYDEGAPVSAI